MLIILSQKYSTSISTRIVPRQIVELSLCRLHKQGTYCIIVSKYIAICSIDAIFIADDFDRFDLFFLF